MNLLATHRVINSTFLLVLGLATAIAQPIKPEPAAVVSSAANDQLLYFTSTSLLADDQRVVFLSDRTGQPNIFLRDLRTGVDQQLTTNREGFLKSYVYFDGVPYRGLGRASVSVDAERGVVYYLQGRSISDGCYTQAGDPSGGSGAWISVLQVDWATRQYRWQPLCRSGSSWDSQDSHPHPIFNHAADAVYFTSDKTGKRAIWRTAAPSRLETQTQSGK